MAKSFDWQKLKANTRQIVHDTFAGGSTYLDPSLNTPVDLDVRWHNKSVLGGDLESGGYAEIVEGIERVIFNIPQLELKGITLKARALVTMADGTKLRLSVKNPKVGPIEEVWDVTRE